MTQKMICPDKKITRAGEAALYFHDNPEELPTGAPDPHQDAAAFAEWWNKRENKTVKLVMVKP